ncbi:MAG: radical SAM protein [Bdellovibrionales bacterium]|nr:radical SAM protein [Bdellovibrionales bacterium]
MEGTKKNQPRYGFYGRLSSEFPSQIIVDVTEVCNLKCIHCPHPEFAKSEHYDARMLDPELNRKLVDEVRDFGQGLTQYLRYTSDGEPLIHKQCLEMLEYAKANSGVMVALTTNGRLMTETVQQKLVDIGIDLIDISLDAFTPETYAKIRVGGNLEVTKRHILGLIDKRNKAQSQLKVVVSFIEQPENKNEIADFETFWKAAGADFVVVRRLHSAAGANKKTADIMWQLVKNETRKPCTYPWERIVLQPSGFLSFCPADWTKGSKVIPYKDTTVRETWSSKFYQDLRAAHMSNNFSCHSFCGNCPDWSVVQWPDEGRAYADMMMEFQRSGADVIA